MTPLEKQIAIAKEDGFEWYLWAKTEFKLKVPEYRRLGWYGLDTHGEVRLKLRKDGLDASVLAIASGLPDYLNSHDALLPVLAKMSEEEWSKFASLLYEKYQVTSPAKPYAQWVLTQPPSVLADIYLKVKNIL